MGAHRYYLHLLLIAMLLATQISLPAQLCTGSLGDPVVKIDFGNGSGTGGYVPTNAYQYSNSGCPNDGYYTIATSIPVCWGGVWHTPVSDHTGGGAFLLVNATFTPGDFFVSRVSGLCPGTTYEFAAWMMNVIKGGGIRPNVTFRIEDVSGNVLQSYNTGDVPNTALPEWRQYGFFFTTSNSATEVVLRMTNNAPGGIGNDIAMDDITFRPCGPTVNSTIVGYGDSAAACVEQPNTYSMTAAVSAGYNNPLYQWEVSDDGGRNWTNITGATTLSYTRPSSAPGNYLYRVAVAESVNGNRASCNVHSNLLKVTVHPPPIVNAGPDRTSLSGNTITLNASVTGDQPTYVWRPSVFLSDSVSLTPTLTPLNDQVYTLYATSKYGCRAQDEMMVRVANDIYVPNAFTPNNDGLNDYWRIPFLDPGLDATVRVVNRYGQVVYQVTADNVNWDGKWKGVDQPAGTYVYQVTFKDGRPVMKGTVMLIR
jgi:gliding motility-associated-like protein